MFPYDHIFIIYILKYMGVCATIYGFVKIKNKNQRKKEK